MKGNVKDFRTLKVWERAHLLALSVYRLTQGFPKEELYGITSQMRRSGSSIAANIAEGCGRSGNGEFHRFLNVAMGSAVEWSISYCWLWIWHLSRANPMKV